MNSTRRHNWLRTAFTVFTVTLIGLFLSSFIFGFGYLGEPSVVFVLGSFGFQTVPQGMGFTPGFVAYDLSFKPDAEPLATQFDLTSNHITIAFPLWPIVLPAAFCNLLWLWFTRPNRPRPGFCPKCNYDLRATPDRCPECGQNEPSQRGRK